jgi:AraC-like DNA-binding protein
MLSLGQTSFQTYFPSPELAPYVQYYAVFEICGIKDNTFVDEIVPMNMSGLNFISEGNIYHYRQEDAVYTPFYPVSLLAHLRHKTYSKFIGTGNGVLVIFSSIGLYRLFGINMKELENKVQDATLFINEKEISECRRKIFDLEAERGKISIVEGFLIDQLRKSTLELRRFDEIIRFIQEKKGYTEIGDLCYQSNMSLKTFERHFDQKIGICPKTYCEITRFATAFKMIKSGKNVFQILNRCGYVDQAHLIREFKKFTGNTPKYYYKNLPELSDYFLELSVAE